MNINVHVNPPLHLPPILSVHSKTREKRTICLVKNVEKTDSRKDHFEKHVFSCTENNTNNVIFQHQTSIHIATRLIFAVHHHLSILSAPQKQ